MKLNFSTTFFLLFSLLILVVQSRANSEAVLGRTIRLDVLCDDFEDTKWEYSYQNHISSNKLWRSGSGDGEPELLKRIITPKDGKNGSNGALEIRTNKIELNDDGDLPGNSVSEKFLTAEYKKNSGYRITLANQPVFIVRVWLPPFNEWIAKYSKEDHYDFSFRHEAFPKNGDKYYPSIFLHHDTSLPKPYFVVRVFPIGTKEKKVDIPLKPIVQPYWWTLAIAFDKDGVDHYYACPGTGVPTEENEIFNTAQFRSKDSVNTPSMEHILYSFFGLGYPKTGNASPPFVIDDYEVWVVKE